MAWFALVWVGVFFQDSYMVCVNHPFIFLKSARVELVVGHVLARARVYGGRLLLLRRSNDPGRGLWWTPGGRIRLGEPLEQAAAWELAEETGLWAERLEVRGVMCHFWPGAQFVTAFLRADVSTDEVRRARTGGKSAEMVDVAVSKLHGVLEDYDLIYYD